MSGVLSSKFSLSNLTLFHLCSMLYLKKILGPEDLFHDCAGDFSRGMLATGDVAGEDVLNPSTFEKADKPSEILFPFPLLPDPVLP